MDAVTHWWQARPGILYAFSLALTGLVFVVDLVTPVGSASWLLYFVPFLLLAQAPRAGLLYAAAALFTLLMALEILLAAPIAQAQVGLFNRMLAAAVIWAAAHALVLHRRTEEELRRSHEQLEARVRERTAELAETNAALRESTRMLEGLVRACPVGIFVLDPAGRVVLWNYAAERTLGWTEDEVRGQFVPTATAGQEGANAVLARVLAGERFSGVELRRTRKDGVPVDLLLWTAPLRQEDGALRNTVAILLDITHLKKMERVAVAQEKLASLGQAAAGIAHEIRNPLSGVNIYLHCLKTLLAEEGALRPDLRKQAEEVISSIQGASKQMESVVERVLSFSRPGRRRTEPFHVNDCIRHAVEIANMSLLRAGVRLTVAPQDDLPSCRGDARLVEQALINLLTNAAQAMEEGPGARFIEVGSSLVAAGNGGYVSVSVADSGPGIPEDVRERIFEPFFTTKTLGTGIGLSITQKIVSDHGGFIKVGVSRWGGALFTIGLPALLTEAGAPERGGTLQ